MSLKKKLIIGAGVVGLGFTLCAGSTKETGCQPFRTSTNLANGEGGVLSIGPDSNIKAFEDYRDESELEDLDKGELYNFTIKKYLLGRGRVISHTACTPQ